MKLYSSYQNIDDYIRNDQLSAKKKSKDIAKRRNLTQAWHFIGLSFI